MKIPSIRVYFFLGLVTSSALCNPSGNNQVLTGIDVLIQDGFKQLQNKRIGLLTNHTGRSRGGRSTIDILYNAPDIKLIALFSPEHGMRGILDELTISDSRDEKTGLKIYSLYGANLKLTDTMLAGIDTMVIDIQDIGVRFYTYISTMGYALEEAAKRNISVFVLDRPNPLNGNAIEGPISQPSTEIISYFCMPVRHGLTIGELALLFNSENKINANLTVISMQNWRRDLWFDATGLTWVNPSPNMRNLNQALLYPGIGSIEYSNISVGRGTDQPFEQLGALWINGPELAQALNNRNLPGVRFYPVIFTPKSSLYANIPCHGVFILILDRNQLQPVRMGLEVASVLCKLWPDKYNFTHELHPQKLHSGYLLGSVDHLELVRRGEDPAQVSVIWSQDEYKWRALRKKYLLY